MNKESDNQDFVRYVQDRLGLKIDGWAGQATRNAFDALLPKPAPTASGVIIVVDDRSESNIKTLHQKIQNKAREFVFKVRQSGIDMKVISGNRTYAEQDEIYAQGRTRPGEIVTKARGGYSNHNFSVALDVGIFDKSGKYLENSPLYREVSKVGKALGFNWGGDWAGSLVDEPHYEWPTGLTLAQMRERVAKGESVL